MRGSRITYERSRLSQLGKEEVDFSCGETARGSGVFFSDVEDGEPASTSDSLIAALVVYANLRMQTSGARFQDTECLSHNVNGTSDNHHSIFRHYRARTFNRNGNGLSDDGIVHGVGRSFANFFGRRRSFRMCLREDHMIGKWK